LLKLFMEKYSAIDKILKSDQLEKMKYLDYDQMSLMNYSWAIKNFFPEPRI
jgi:transposase